LGEAAPQTGVLAHTKHHGPTKPAGKGNPSKYAVQLILQADQVRKKISDSRRVAFVDAAIATLVCAVASRPTEASTASAPCVFPSELSQIAA